MKSPNINHKFNGFSRQYQAALRTYVKRGRPANLRPAEGLGRHAMAMGLETLKLAKIHREAQAKLVLPHYSPVVREAMIRRMGFFFSRVITPIEKNHRLAQESSVRMTQLNHKLRWRSADLIASNRQLKQEIVQRKVAEESLRKSEQHYGRLLTQSRQMQERLRHLSRQLLSAQEEERKKISRELHDVIAQTLTSINFRLAALKKEAFFDTKGLERSISRTQQLVQQSVNIVHQFARELRPTVLDDLGLVPALHTFLKGFRSDTGILVSLSAFPGIEKIDGEKRTVLFRVAQEALTNVARHARASRVQVKIRKLDGLICMKIKDNGRGFLAERTLRAKKSKRLGLLGMKERLEMVGGNIAVTSAPGKGTTILAHIPLIETTVRGEEAPLIVISKTKY